MRYRIDQVLNIVDDSGGIDEYFSVAEDADGLGLVTLVARNHEGKEMKYLSFDPEHALTVAAALTQVAHRLINTNEITTIKE